MAGRRHPRRHDRPPRAQRFAAAGDVLAHRALLRATQVRGRRDARRTVEPRGDVSAKNRSTTIWIAYLPATAARTGCARSAASPRALHSEFMRQRVALRAAPSVPRSARVASTAWPVILGAHTAEHRCEGIGRGEFVAF